MGDRLARRHFSTAVPNFSGGTRNGRGARPSPVGMAAGGYSHPPAARDGIEEAGSRTTPLSNRRRLDADVGIPKLRTATSLQPADELVFFVHEDGLGHNRRVTEFEA